MGTMVRTKATAEFRVPTGDVNDSQQIPLPDRRQRWGWGLQCAVILAVIWLSLTGLDALLLGVITAALGGVFGALVVPGHPYTWRPLRLLRFLVYFLKESIAGGFDVAWRALHPRLEVRPGWLRYPLTLPAGQPRTLMVSILSLVPGTLSVDLEANDSLLVHALLDEDPAATLATVKRLEHEIAWFFSLAGPDDPKALASPGSSGSRSGAGDSGTERDQKSLPDDSSGDPGAPS